MNDDWAQILKDNPVEKVNGPGLCRLRDRRRDDELKPPEHRFQL